jgi:hypothetical protein
MKTTKSVKNQQLPCNNESKQFRLRRPKSLPKSCQWAIGPEDQSFYESLVRQGKQYEATYFLAFLEATYGGNAFGGIKNDESRRLDRARKANDADVMNAARIQSIDSPHTPLAGHLASHADQTHLGQRSKQHIDACSKTNANHIENAMIEYLDETMPTKGSARQSKKRKG